MALKAQHIFRFSHHEFALLLSKRKPGCQVLRKSGMPEIRFFQEALQGPVCMVSRIKGIPRYT